MNDEYNNGFGDNIPPDEGDYVYKTVMDGKRKSRAWSVASLIVSIFSLICCCFSWPGIVLGVLSIVFAIISRRNIGYFDTYALAGLIVGIFGLVFSITGLISSYMLESTAFYKEFLEEFERYYNQQGGSVNGENYV